jgi:hypothetical protein
MVKCTKGQVRRLKTALHWKIPPEQRQRIQMVLLRESGMTQRAIADAMGVSPSTVNRAHMAYDGGGLAALKPKPIGGRKRENMTMAEENVWPAPSASGFCSWPKNSLHKRIRPFGYAVDQDGDPRVLLLIRGTASSVPFSAVGLQNTDRLSGHLSLNHPQTSLTGY